MLEYLGPESIKYQVFFLKRLIEQIVDETLKVRQSASYGVGLMAMKGGEENAQHFATAVSLIIQVIKEREGRSVKNIQAKTENSINAVMKILKFNM